MNRREFVKRAALGLAAVAVAPAMLAATETMGRGTGRHIVKGIPANAYAEIMLAELPEGLSWYEVGGQRIFQLYGDDGGLRSHQIAYLVRNGDAIGPTGNFLGVGGPSYLGNGWEVYGVKFSTIYDGLEQRRVRSEIDRVIKRWCGARGAKFLGQL